MNKVEEIRNRFSKQVEKEVQEWDVIPPEERPTSIVLVAFFSLLLLYFLAHQILSTGFFTPAFGPLEMIMLYGSLSTWITTSALILLSRKALSRDFDSFGGLLFAGLGIAWVFVVFPFDFIYFANVLPDFLRILLLWISNEIARVLMVLSIMMNLLMAAYSLILRLAVRKARNN